MTALGRLHAAVTDPHPLAVELGLAITLADAVALVEELRAACPECTDCVECGTALCEAHAIGDPSECADNPVCASCWPGRCRDCRAAADADVDYVKERQP